LFHLASDNELAHVKDQQFMRELSRGSPIVTVMHSLRMLQAHHIDQLQGNGHSRERKIRTNSGDAFSHQTLRN